MPIPKGAYWICNCRHPRTPVYYADEMDRLRAGLQRIGELSASYMPVVARLLRGESIEQIATAAPISSKTDVKHERRVVGHVSGWKEQMDTCVCGKPWPCPELESSKDVVLAPCPHCGRQESVEFNNRSDELEELDVFGWWRVICSGNASGCGSSSGYWETQEEAAQHWNARMPSVETTVLHEGVRQSYLKACELSLASGLLGDGDRSDLLELYKSLWPKAPSDIRKKALMRPVEPTPCPECVAVRKIGLLSCHKHIPEKAGCALCAEGMNSFSDPTTGNRMHARNGVVTVCTGPGPMPQWGRLLLECRDALPHITLAAARLAGLDLTLADRIEALLEPWKVAPDDPNGV